MRVCLLVFCLGLALPSRFSVLPDTGLLWPVLALLFCFVIWLCLQWLVSACSRYRRAVRSAATLTVLLCCLLLGLTWSLTIAVRQLSARLPAELEGVDIWISGKVVSLIRQRQRNWQFDFQVDGTCFQLLPDSCKQGGQQPDALRGKRIRLSDYSGLGLRTGEQWWLRVRLSRIHGLSNPGTYDIEAALFQQGMVARGYIRETRFNQRLQPAGYGIQPGRAAITKRLQGLSELNHSALLRALVIGDRDGLDARTRDIFSQTGTSHLMVISGLHIGLIGLLAYGAVNFLSRLSPRLLERFPAQQAAAVAALCAALMYSLLAGFSLSTQRAMVMLGVLMAGYWCGRRFLPSYRLLLAAVVVLMLDPLSVIQAGFWLSFTAVAALLFAFTGYLPVPGTAPGMWERFWRRCLKPQWVVSCGLLLPLLVWTGQLPLVSSLANVLAIPVVSFAVIPLALAGSASLFVWEPLGKWLLILADALLHGVVNMLTWLVQWDIPLVPVVWQGAVPGLFSGLCLVLASIVLLMPAGLLPRWFAVCLLAPSIFPSPPERPPVGQVWLHFLDVGQGLAVVVQTRSHTLLFDTGPSYGEGGDAGRTVILPFLRHQRVSSLDTVVVSHWHDDHSGGLLSVMRELPVKGLLAGRVDGSLPVEACRAGRKWEWDGVEFNLLHPQGRQYEHENNYSCVLRIDASGQAALLTGDIEVPVEQMLLARHSGRLQAQLLQVAHHGSHTSSSQAFLQAVRPQWAIVSAAYRNRFDHPDAEVVARLAGMGTKILQTGRHGAITAVLGDPAAGPGISMQYRLRARRYWHNLPSPQPGHP